MTAEEQIQKLTAERDAALKACAEMRMVMSATLVAADRESACQTVDDLDELRDRLQHALSSDCGRGYVKAESLKCFKCDDGHTPLYCLNCAREGYISHQSLIADIEREVLDDEGAMSYAKENGEWDRYSRLEGHKDGLLWVKHHLQALAHAEKLLKGDKQ